MPSTVSAAQVKPINAPTTIGITPGQTIVNKPIKVSEMPTHPAGLKEAKHYKKMMEWYSKVEDPDGKLNMHKI